MADSTVLVRRPFGDAPVISLTATGTQDITVEASGTEIDGVTVEATANRTINITAGEFLQVGDLVHVRLQTNGTETTTFGTGVTAPTITGVASNIFTLVLRYNGTAFEQLGAAQNINA